MQDLAFKLERGESAQVGTTENNLFVHVWNDCDGVLHISLSDPEGVDLVQIESRNKKVTKLREKLESTYERLEI